MFSLFEEYNPTSQSHYLFPEWDFVRRNMLENIEYILVRLHERPMTLHKAHPLVNLLMNIGFRLDIDLDTYMRIAEERLFYLTFDEGFTSSSSYGKLLNGIFYGDGVREIIIVDDNDFDYKKHINNWRYVSPLNVILSPISDFSYITPTGKHKWDLDDGIAVFSLNLKKLLFVYYMWNKHNVNVVKRAKDEMLLGTHHLIMMIILPNILISQINMIILNRMMNYFYGKPMSKPVKRLSFTVKDLTRRLDRSLFHMLDIAEKNTYTYETMLKMWPAITLPNMYDFLFMPDIALTRQVNWAYAVSRASIMRFLIDIGGQKDINMNKRLLVDAGININLLYTEHVLEPRLPKNIYYDIKEDLDFIYSLTAKI